MSTKPELSADGRSVTVHLPLAFKRRSGRKRMVRPEGHAPWAPSPPRVDSTLLKALARAHRWQAMLDGGQYASVSELAAAERINPSYLARVMRLILLAPIIVELVLDGEHDPERVTLERLTKPFPLLWGEQANAFRYLRF